MQFMLKLYLGEKNRESVKFIHSYQRMRYNNNNNNLQELSLCNRTLKKMNIEVSILNGIKFIFYGIPLN